MARDHAPDNRQPGDTGSRARYLFAAAMLVLAAIFVGLGTWQVQRLFWKLDLIARVDARVNAEAVSAPAPATWARIDRETDEYRRVRARGTFDHDKETLVQAVTERGPGFWVLTPLKQSDGSTILVNRGFVPPERRDAGSRSDANVPDEVEVTGLLRMPEPGGAFLRSNDPASDRWYSRDVAAIAAARGLTNVAPYFIDADATANSGAFPVGGLTVVHFRNTHLVYALTWYALAIMSAGAGYAVYRLSMPREFSPEVPK